MKRLLPLLVAFSLLSSLVLLLPTTPTLAQSPSTVRPLTDTSLCSSTTMVTLPGSIQILLHTCITPTWGYGAQSEAWIQPLGGPPLPNGESASFTLTLNQVGASGALASKNFPPIEVLNEDPVLIGTSPLLTGPVVFASLDLSVTDAHNRLIWQTRLQSPQMHLPALL